MKTPRDILLARHQAAAPKLDAIRRRVVRELNNQETKGQSWLAALVAWWLSCSTQFRQELIWPCRRFWLGLTVVWLLLLIVNFSQSDNVNGGTGNPVRSGGVILSLQAQQRLLNELLADRTAPIDADRPRIFSPKPRSQTQEVMTA